MLKPNFAKVIKIKLSKLIDKIFVAVQNEMVQKRFFDYCWSYIKFLSYVSKRTNASYANF
jgi:hypothetical protein